MVSKTASHQGTALCWYLEWTVCFSKRSFFAMDAGKIFTFLNFSEKMSKNGIFHRLFIRRVII